MGPMSLCPNFCGATRYTGTCQAVNIENEFSSHTAPVLRRSAHGGMVRGMKDKGAKVSEIQARLGHESLEITGCHLAQLSSGENPYLDRLSELLGMDLPADSDASDDEGNEGDE
jgi:hypothetical protein